MYGMGYGLARMGEGVTSGMAKGSLVNMMGNEREQARQDKLAAQQATQDYRKSVLDQNKHRIENASERVGLAREALAMKHYLAVLEKTGDQTQAKNMYKTLDPGGDVPHLTLKEDNEVEIEVDGYKFIGPRKEMGELLGLIETNPEDTFLHLKTGVELGFTKIVMPEEKEDKPGRLIPVGPYQSLYSEDEGKFITTPRGKDKEKKPELKPSQALRRISDIRKARAALGETSIITAMITQYDPALANRINNRLSKSEKDAVLQAWENEINYLQQFIPKPGTGTLGAMMNPQGGIGYQVPPGAQKTTRAVYDANTGGFSYR